MEEFKVCNYYNCSAKNISIAVVNLNASYIITALTTYPKFTILHLGLY